MLLTVYVILSLNNSYCMHTISLFYATPSKHIYDYRVLGDWAYSDGRTCHIAQFLGLCQRGRLNKCDSDAA